MAEIIDLADQDALGLSRSRSVEQNVLDIIDALRPAEIWLADLGLSAKSRPVINDSNALNGFKSAGKTKV